MTDKVVGILGGGQLGRMLGASASLLNIPVIILSPGVDSPAKQVLSYPPSSPCAHIDGSFTDPTAIKELARKVDVLTVEIEHVDVAALEDIQRTHPNVEIHPSPGTIRIIQDKFIQKEHLRTHRLPISPFLSISAEASIESAAHDLGLPLMLKARTLAYDGRGNYALHKLSDIDKALKVLGNRPLYAEKWVPFNKEVAVMVVRSRTGEVKSYTTVETVHKDNICHLVFAGCGGLGGGVEENARKVAEDAVRSFEGGGVFGVEMFLMDDGSLYINEIAPRPHNSGHYTIEACLTSQYSNHLRAILALPLGSTDLIVPCAAMLNLIAQSSSPDDLKLVVDSALATPGATVHLYGKGESRKGRKMGHITVVAESEAQLRDRLRYLLPALPSSSPTSVVTDLDLFCPLPKSRAHSHPFPLVGIIMGSDSDLPVMKAATDVLDRFMVPFELTIVSAHRTPDRLTSYANAAAPRGIRCIIAGAGGAAHLPGMVASMTGLPVVGVPVKGSSLDGVDSLYSIVQMPRGIPVATVAINNSTNAALLAVRILSAGMPRLVREMELYLTSLEHEVMGKVGKLEEIGWEAYDVKR